MPAKVGYPQFSQMRLVCTFNRLLSQLCSRRVYLDFGNGQGYQQASWNAPLAVQYSSAGTYRVKVKISYAGTTAVGPATYESQFDLQVLATTSPSQSQAAKGPTPQGANGTNGWVYPQGALTVTFGPTAAHSGGKVTIVYGGLSRRQITKPLIVAEGYDPSTIAPSLQSNYNVKNFLNYLLLGYNGLNVRDEFGADNYSSSTSAAYDLIFIDYNNGTDDIRRNAALFEDVVRYVNQQKQGGTASGQQNVVLGISMGGLVARYGLAEMEKAQPGSTNTRLLITHDSPHRGANTPLGIQALTRQGASTWLGQTINLVNSSGIPHLLTGSNIFPELMEGDRLLDEPATKQLLLVRATVQRGSNAANSTYGYEYNSFLANEYRSMITPASGQNFPYRFVATSLGSQCGKPVFAPYTELTRIEAEGYATVGLASAGLHTQIITNALPPAGQVQRISSLRIWFQVRVLVFTAKFYFSNLAYQSPNNNPVAWDGLPGGVQYIKSQLPLKTGSSYGGRLIFVPIASLPIPVIVGYAKNVQAANTFCFIPSASALDVPLTSANSQARYVNGVANSNPAPQPQAFIAEGSDYDSSIAGYTNNYPHPFFTGRFGQWIYNEMERPFNGDKNSVCDANAECSAVTSTITGPAQLCPGATAIYTVSNLPANAQVRWSVSPSGLVAPTSGTGSSFSVQALAGASGQPTIQATLVTSAGGCELPLPGRALTVSASYVSIGGYGGCGGLPATFTASGQALGTNYRWTINRQAQPQFNDQAQITYTLPTNPAIRQLPVTVTVAGTCPGAGTLSDTYDVVIEHGAGCANERIIPPATGSVTASVYPNPASESVYVRLENADVSRPTTVRLFDSQGQLRLEHTTKGETTIKLKVNKLPSGIYFVHVLRGSDIITRQQLRIE